MSTNYSGNPANVSAALTRTIIGCSSGTGSKVLVQTSVSHLFSTFDYVSISGVTGTTEANGTHQITVVSADTFLLTTVPFVHAYVSGGTAVDISLTPYFTIPSDGAVLTAQNLFSGLQLVADRTQYIQKYLAQTLSFQKQAFTSSSTFVVPVSVSQILVELCGGGGGAGGGGGWPGEGASAGGGGGGGAVLNTGVMSVTPGETLTVTVGAGGAGGSGTGSGTFYKSFPGADGGDSSVAGGLATVTAKGGGLGNAGEANAGGSATVLSIGGFPVGSIGALANLYGSNPGYFVSTPQCGGAGANKVATTALVLKAGFASPQGYAGGVAGGTGADGGGNSGGGSGGGGGAGAFGVGGAGGTGSDENGLGGLPGGNGTAGAANTGAGGGGGGGAGGTGIGTNPTGGNGGSGGSGLVIISYVGGTFT